MYMQMIKDPHTHAIHFIIPVQWQEVEQYPQSQYHSSVLKYLFIKECFYCRKRELIHPRCTDFQHELGDCSNTIRLSSMPRDKNDKYRSFKNHILVGRIEKNLLNVAPKV